MHNYIRLFDKFVINYRDFLDSERSQQNYKFSVNENRLH